MATTSAFGWETPDDTDLVKDGAAAIRTLGNSIDTSMSELKGGTTGQYLTKTSNTDMDFTWATGTYSTFTPGGFSNFTLGNGTVSGRFRQFGKTVFMQAIITLGSTSSVTGSIVMQFPVSANTANNSTFFGQARLVDAGVNEYNGTLLQNGLNFFTIAGIAASGLYASNQGISATVPFIWGTGDVIQITGTYEAA